MPEVRYVGGSRYALRDGPTWTEGDVYDIDGATADRLTDLDKFEVVEDDGGGDGDSGGDSGNELPGDRVPDDDLAAMIDDGVCPWCSEYEGENVGMHAARAHPGEWDGYTEADG